MTYRSVYQHDDMPYVDRYNHNTVMICASQQQTSHPAASYVAMDDVMAAKRVTRLAMTLISHLVDTGRNGNVHRCWGKSIKVPGPPLFPRSCPFLLPFSFPQLLLLHHTCTHSRSMTFAHTYTHTHTFTMTFNAMTPPVLFSPCDFQYRHLPAPVLPPIDLSSAAPSLCLLTDHASDLPPLFGRAVLPRITPSGIYIDNGLRATKNTTSTENGLRATKKSVRIAREIMGPTPNLDVPFTTATEQSSSSRLITAHRRSIYSVLSNPHSFDVPGAASPSPKPLTKFGRIMLKRKIRLHAKFEAHKKQKAELAAVRSRFKKVVGVVAAGAVVLGCMAARWFF